MVQINVYSKLLFSPILSVYFLVNSRITSIKPIINDDIIISFKHKQSVTFSWKFVQLSGIIVLIKSHLFSFPTIIDIFNHSYVYILREFSIS